MTKRTVTNTRVETDADPRGFLAEAFVLGTGNAIERQEARGQAELVLSDTLPADCSETSKAALENAGVVFGKHVGGDTLFRQARLPEGWKKAPTTHAMWSNLVDDLGRVRAQIFYKAAFYDRSARLSARSRFSVAEDYAKPGDYETARARVMDGERVLFETDWITCTAPPRGLPPAEHVEAWRAYEVREKTESANAKAGAWLHEHYPNWRDVGAYWDAP